jgi:hypothetical protein
MMEREAVLRKLAGEDKKQDERDENRTAITRKEGNRVKSEYREAKWRTENELLVEKLEGQRQDRSQRKDFAVRIFWFVCAYMACVFLILVFSGIKGNGFILSDAVLVTLLGTTTATIVGVFNFVARYLFHNKT